MNVSIVVLKNQRLCMTYDQRFPFPIKALELDVNSFEITILFASDNFEPIKLDYPLDYNLMPAILENEAIYTCFADTKQSLPMVEVPILFAKK